MDNILAQTYAACMWAYQHAKFSGHEQDAEDFRYASQSARVDLRYVDGICLEQLLEHHPIVCMLPRGNTDVEGFESLSDRGMPQDIIWCSWLFDEPTNGWIAMFLWRQKEDKL